MPTATPEQTAWTQGYDACRQHVGQQRLPQVKEAIDTEVTLGRLSAEGGESLKRHLDTIFSDLGFPFAGPDRITDRPAFSPEVNVDGLVRNEAPKLGMPYWDAVPGGRKCPSCGEVIPVTGTKLTAAVHEHWATHQEEG